VPEVKLFFWKKFSYGISKKKNLELGCYFFHGLGVNGRFFGELPNDKFSVVNLLVPIEMK